MAEEPIVVYSDYVCPFCYLGKASLEQYLEETDDPPPVEWHPYDLRGYKRRPDGTIDHDVDDGKDDDYFAQVRDNVQRLKEEYDVDMTLEFSLEVDSWDAQQLALYAKQSYDEETFRGLHEDLFDALWQERRDIGDPDVLVDIAGEHGIPEDEVRDAISDETLGAELRERFEAAQAEGVTGIPTFAYGEHAARGAVPPAQLRRLVGDV